MLLSLIMGSRDGFPGGIIILTASTLYFFNPVTYQEDPAYDFFGFCTLRGTPAALFR
jgi:hypothetical protein